MSTYFQIVMAIYAMSHVPCHLCANFIAKSDRPIKPLFQEHYPASSCRFYESRFLCNICVSSMLLIASKQFAIEPSLNTKHQCFFAMVGFYLINLCLWIGKNIFNVFSLLFSTRIEFHRLDALFRPCSNSSICINLLPYVCCSNMKIWKVVS